MLNEFVQQNKNMVRDMINGIHTAMPAVILSFDPGSCMAVIQPKCRIKDNKGNLIDYPQVSGVPVIFIQSAGQTATLAYPINPGDGCLFIAAEQSLDYWMYGKDTPTDLKFDLTNGIAIPGLFVQPNTIVADACSQNAVIIDNSGTRIALTDGEISITGNVTINGNLNVTGDVQTGGINLNTHIHGGVSSGLSNTGGPL